MIGVDEVLSEVFARQRERAVAPPNSAALARRLARQDRALVARRAGFAAAGIALAIVVALATTRGAGGELSTIAPGDQLGAAAATTTIAPDAAAAALPPGEGTAPAVEVAPTAAAAPSVTAAPGATPAIPTPEPEGDPEDEEPPPEDPGPVAGTWSAAYTYGTSEEDPPYDTYFGTAPADSAIDITSPYGSASTVADPDGYWHLSVLFPSAPVGETFSVTVTNQAGSTTLSFTRTA